MHGNFGPTIVGTISGRHGQQYLSRHFLSMLACVGLKSGKARTSLQHRLPAETGREPGESRESNKTGVEQGDMQRKQLTGHASKRVYDWQSGMAHWGETQRYGSMGWPNGSAER